MDLWLYKVEILCLLNPTVDPESKTYIFFCFHTVILSSSLSWSVKCLTFLDLIHEIPLFCPVNVSKLKTKFHVCQEETKRTLPFQVSSSKKRYYFCERYTQHALQ